MEKDLDFGIKWWFKDIPYFWGRSLEDEKKRSQKDWKTYNRIYIMPLIKGIGNDKISEFLRFKEKVKSLNCNQKYLPYILNYFRITNNISDYKKYPINVNGRIIFDSKHHPKDVEDLYQKLKLTDKIKSYEFSYQNLYGPKKQISILSGKYDDTVPKSNKIESYLKCGFKLPLEHYISNLVCLNLSSRDVKSFLDGNKICTTVGNIITNNLIRVASQRMYTEPYRSLLEPISNSIDSYRELRGESSIGKFGMGFFSLLWWLVNPNDQLIIESTYLIPETKKFCKWKCIIRLQYENS
jgi:hypothetical protein